MLIRSEKESDRDGVYAVNVSAFETPSEANLVDVLRERASPIVSLVAEHHEEVIGHILFSPVSLLGHPDVKLMGLGPLAVAPKRQRRGVGSALVRAGLEQCTELGFGAVVVLGHPVYYRRFGFLPSSRFGSESEFEVPAEGCMAMELHAKTLCGKTGRVQYHAAFSNL